MEKDAVKSDTSAADTQTSLSEYMAEMDELQKKAYNIAKEHLGTSFNVLKSNGYIEWCKKKK